jgi:hypothetical protein
MRDPTSSWYWMIRFPKRTLDEVFGPEGPKLRQVFGLPGRAANEAVGQLDEVLGRRRDLVTQALVLLRSFCANSPDDTFAIAGRAPHILLPGSSDGFQAC